MRASLNLVVFTDLDGTLLDRVTYSYALALPALRLLQKKRIPVVFCSSKTRAEQEVYRKELGVSDPFIVENGGAIFIPRHYFSFPFDYHKALDDFLIIELGISYEKIRQSLNKIREEGDFHFRGFGDMSVEEVAADTGLDLEAARRAKRREYEETVKFEGRPEEIEKALNSIKKAGLNYVYGGRYYGVMGPNDKGWAATIIINLFRKKLGRVKAIGIGDNLNDLPLLSVVDMPILVQKEEGCWENINLGRLRKVQGVGPEGWARAIQQIVGA
jgi:mannosyl-3-phosphoglycerate phosphatase